MKHKYQIGIAALLLVGMLAAGAFAFGGFRQGGPFQNSAAQAAITADDYNAFVNATGKNITEDQFNKIVDGSKKMSAVRDAMTKAQDAIKNNDFAAWKDALSAISVNQTRLTQETFNAQVQTYQARQKVEQAVASNDFASWKQAMSDLFQLQLTQESFDETVKRYQAHGNQTAMPNGHFGGFMGMNPFPGFHHQFGPRK